MGSKFSSSAELSAMFLGKLGALVLYLKVSKVRIANPGRFELRGLNITRVVFKLAHKLLG